MSDLNHLSSPEDPSLSPSFAPVAEIEDLTASTALTIQKVLPEGNAPDPFSSEEVRRAILDKSLQASGYGPLENTEITLEYFLKYMDGLEYKDLDMLTTLSVENAELIGSWHGYNGKNISLNGLSTISHETVAALGRWSSLSLDGLTAIDAKTFTLLCTNSEEVTLNGLKDFDDKLVDALHSLRDMEPHGSLELNGLTSLPPALAAGFSSASERIDLASLHLNGLEAASLSPSDKKALLSWPTVFSGRNKYAQTLYVNAEVKKELVSAIQQKDLDHLRHIYDSHEDADAFYWRNAYDGITYK